MFSRLFLTTFLLLSLSAIAQDGQNSDKPGFTEAVFGKTEILNLLDKLDDTNGLRFYNIMDDGSVRVMAVAINALGKNGQDLHGGSLYRPYLVAVGLENNRINTIKKNVNNAEKAAIDLKSNPSYLYYCTHYSAEDLKNLFDSNPTCNALKIIPTEKSDPLSMEVHAVKFDEGKVTDLGSGSGFDLNCSDPCPPICGPNTNYILPPK